MSAVVKTVKSAFKVVEKAGKAVIKAVEKVGKAVVSVVETVGKAVESLVKIAKPLLENYAIQAALMAAGIPPVYAAPMSAGLGTLARGGDVEDALKSAATSAALQNINKGVYDKAIKEGFTATQAAAASSAATSAVAAAAQGGNIEDVLKSAAIGGAAGAAGTEVYKQTQNTALAAFTRGAVVSSLQGLELKQVIINGATAGSVAFLQEAVATQERITQVEENRQKIYDKYIEDANEYNRIVELYNNSQSQAEADSYRAQLDALLPRIENYSNQISQLNQQIADLSGVRAQAEQKALEELQPSDVGLEEDIAGGLTLAEEELIRRIEDVYGQEFAGQDVSADALRGFTQQEIFEQELTELEQALSGVTSEAEKDRQRMLFAMDQRQKLAQSGRLPGQLDAQIQRELNQILDEFEAKSKFTEEQKQQLRATQQERGAPSDQDVIDYLGLTPAQAERYGLTTGERYLLDGVRVPGLGFQADLEELPPEETIGYQPIDYMELFRTERESQGLRLPETPNRPSMGGGQGLSVDVEGGKVTEEGFISEDYQRPLGVEYDTSRPFTAAVVSRESPEMAGRISGRISGGRGETPGIGTRVTGEALTGILGEKEPLFGGDDDEQRAVWNRRSLRLRRALGL